MKGTKANLNFRSLRERKGIRGHPFRLQMPAHGEKSLDLRSMNTLVRKANTLKGLMTFIKKEVLPSVIIGMSWSEWLLSKCLQTINAGVYFRTKCEMQSMVIRSEIANESRGRTALKWD